MYVDKLLYDWAVVLAEQLLVVVDTLKASLERYACPVHHDHNDVHHKIYIHIYLAELRSVFSVMNIN